MGVPFVYRGRFAADQPRMVLIVYAFMASRFNQLAGLGTALALLLETLGPDHHVVASARNNLAAILLAQGEHEAALAAETSHARLEASLQRREYDLAVVVAAMPAPIKPGTSPKTRKSPQANP